MKSKQKFEHKKKQTKKMENVESNLQATVSSSPYSSPQIKFTESLNSPIENENKISKNLNS